MFVYQPNLPGDARLFRNWQWCALRKLIRLRLSSLDSLEEVFKRFFVETVRSFETGKLLSIFYVMQCKYLIPTLDA